MTATVCKIDTAESSEPVLGRLEKTNALQVDPDAAGYTLVLGGPNQYTISPPEALIGIYRLGIENGDGLEIRFGYIYIANDDVGPYYAVDSYSQAVLDSGLPWNPAWEAELDQVMQDVLTAYVVPTVIQLDAAIALVTAKTDLIGTGGAIINAPVTETGTLSDIVIGDDYNATNNRAFEWVFDAIPGFTAGTCTGKFGGELPNGEATDKWLITNGVTTDEGSGVWKVSFTMDQAITQNLPAGLYNWSVEIIEATEEVTIAKNTQDRTRVKLVEKQTNP